MKNKCKKTCENKGEKNHNFNHTLMYHNKIIKKKIENRK